MMKIPKADGIYSGVNELDYHADRSSLSSSGIRAMLAPSCPAIFRHQQNEPPTPTPQYDFGHAAHRFVLGEGPEIVSLPFDDWRSKDAQTARQEIRTAGKVPMLARDVDNAKAMALAVTEHPLAGALFTHGQPELSGYWHDPETGVRLRYRPDWLTQRGNRIIAVDYKTGTSADPGRFAKAAAEYGYHQQQAFYLDGLAANGFGDVEFLFVVQDKTPPYVTSVCRIDPQHVELGRRRNRLGIDLYAQCRTSGIWPGYPDVIHTIQLPAYATNRQEQEINQ